MFMTNRSWKTRKAVVSSPYGGEARRRDGGQPDQDQNEPQQQQPANHSSDNAEIAPPSLTPTQHKAETLYFSTHAFPRNL